MMTATALSNSRQNVSERLDAFVSDEWPLERPDKQEKRGRVAQQISDRVN